MSTTHTLEQIAQHKIVAIIRAANAEAAVEMAHAIIDGGLPVVEVSFNTPGALEAIRHLAAEGIGTIGAGTVLDPADVEHVAASGAKFMVAPNLNPDVVRAALDAGLVVGPGCFTATELHQAVSLGAQLIKFFPAGAGGIGMMKALGEPFPSTPWLPAGGIPIDDVPHWLAAGAVAIGMGSPLTGGGVEEARTRSSRLRDLVAQTN
jgi:2-dehydro-3-deoxyphosphogluconate aldolase / (4S)-4-hydroxy-2-oxoglutarate aldolase